MRTWRTSAFVFFAITLSGSCTDHEPSAPPQPSSQRSIDRPSQDTETQKSSSGTQREFGPGTFEFVAKVESVYLFPYESSHLNGPIDVDGTAHVFIGADPNWVIKLKIVSSQDGVSILEAGRSVCLVVHSPSRVFAEDGGKPPIGKVRRLLLAVSRADNGREMFFSSLGALRSEAKGAVETAIE